MNNWRGYPFSSVSSMLYPYKIETAGNCLILSMRRLSHKLGEGFPVDHSTLAMTQPKPEAKFPGSIAVT